MAMLRKTYTPTPGDIKRNWRVIDAAGKPLGRVASEVANALRGKDRAIVVVTHYNRMLNYIVPDFVHVMVEGRLVKSGGKELAVELEEKGYGWLDEPA